VATVAADANWYLHFGRYKDRRVCNVPLSYLSWCLRELRDLDPALRAVMAESLRRRSAAVDEDDGDGDDEPAGGGAVIPVDELKARLREWWRPLARRHHPDAGGDGKVMAALNDAKDKLFEALGLD
jgi:hypothetical protein